MSDPPHGHRWLPEERLQDHAVSLGRGNQLVQFLSGGIRIQIELQPDRLKPDGSVTVDPEGAPEIEVSFGPDLALDVKPPRRGYGAERHPGTGDQSLQEHVSGTGEGAVAAGRRVQAGLDQRPAGLDRTGHTRGRQRTFGAQGKHGFRRISSITILQRCLHPSKFVCIHLHTTLHGRFACREARAGGFLPAGFFAQDPERRLAHQLVDEGAVGGVEATAADVAIEPLQLVGLEHPGST
jgi:hypothetical protein